MVRKLKQKPSQLSTKTTKTKGSRVTELAIRSFLVSKMKHFPIEVSNIACRDLLGIKTLNRVSEEIGLSNHIKLLSESKFS